MTALHTLTATQVLAGLDAGDFTAVELVDALIARIEAVDPIINALPVRRFERARAEAREADAARAKGVGGPLCGLPITIKENLALEGFDLTLGIAARRGRPSAVDAPVVAALRAAGAIVIGKGNVPQLLLAQETENPIWGLTRNPWKTTHSAGGSSGGEAAAVAAGYAPLGIGSDIGGSIRIPAHFCGIVGLKPTVDRWPVRGMYGANPGQEVVRSQLGPLARSTADIALMLQVLDPVQLARTDPRVPPLPFADPASLPLKGMRIGWYDHDGYLAPTPALKRAVAEALDHLRAAGAVLVPLTPPDGGEVLYTWLAAISADGGRTIDQQLEGADVIRQLKPSKAMLKLPAPARAAAAKVMGLMGERRVSRLLQVMGEKGVDALWRLTNARTEARLAELDAWNAADVDVVICPAHSVPAMPHGESGDFVLGTGYLFRYSLLDFPAGSVPVTRARAGEIGHMQPGGDRVERKQAAFDAASLGLPVGVQVVARPYHEAHVVAVMAAIEAAARAHSPDYPHTPVTPEPIAS